MKKKTQKKNEFLQIANFIYEVGNHSKTPRSGFWLLGSGEQSVAEHLFRTAFIAYSLAHFVPKADKAKTVLMSLVHDLGEGRTSDLNYVHQRYGQLAESMAMRDIAQSVPFGEILHALYCEEQKRETLEARLVKDADTLEWITSMREEESRGNKKAREWAEIALKRLKTSIGKKIGKLIMEVHPDAWWFDKKDKWFISRQEKDRKWATEKEKR